MNLSAYSRYRTERQFVCVYIYIYIYIYIYDRLYYHVPYKKVTSNKQFQKFPQLFYREKKKIDESY